jgi:alginate O-acetyltransferase complex protein AlgI
MVFSSTVFLFLFLPLFLLGVLLTARASLTARNLNLVVFSLGFYVFGSGIYTLILLGSIVFNWAYARGGFASRPGKRWLALGVFVNLLPLLVFKYLDFLLALSSDLFFEPFFATALPAFKLFLPAGISFYTFQAISYLLDVRRGETPPEPSLLTFAAYKLLFPQLVAGPIVRYVQIRQNLQQATLSLAQFNTGIFFFGMGLAKKLVLADSLGRMVDFIYSQPAAEVTGWMAWLASLGYSLQIFLDFSGYSEMAIGLGLMIGFQFPDNFLQPYRAHSITDFWRRWHVSLSLWFRDYLYIPLGGNRHGLVRTSVNLWVVFLLCGLWHGAALTFVLWGAYHGALLTLERLLKQALDIEVRGVLGVIVTLLLVSIGWVLFRADTLDQALIFLRKLSLLDRGGVAKFGWQYTVTPYTLFLIASGIVVAALPVERWQLRQRLQTDWNGRGAMLGLMFMLLAIAALAANGFNPFIYFQF